MGSFYQTTERKDRQCYKESLELGDEKKVITFYGQVTLFWFRYKKAKAKYETIKTGREFDKYLVDQLMEDHRIP